MNQFYEKNAPWELIGKKLAGELSKEESQELDNWIQEDAAHHKLMEQSEFVWTQSDQIEDLFATDIQEQKAWDHLSKRLNLSAEAEEKIIPLSFWQRYRSGAVAAAAVLLVGILGYYWILPQINDQQQEEIQWLLVDNQLQEPKTVQMPDGSTIVLNKNTSLQYPDKFDQRLVKLEGEAYFEVEHNPEKPFVVAFGNEKVEVLGTSFNIRAYSNQNETKVTVLTGKVRFETATKKQELNKGQAAVYQKAEDQMTLGSSPNATSWKSNAFEFKDQQLGLIVKELENHFQKEIKLMNPALKSCVFRGKYEGAELNRILQEIAFGLELEVEEKDGVFYLNGAACQAD
jgi:transmembrane sensor